jgi:hypothetical protein
MKKIVMLKDYNWQRAGWVGDVFDATAEQWVKEGIAELYESRTLPVEQAVAEERQVETAAIDHRRKRHRR